MKEKSGIASKETGHEKPNSNLVLVVTLTPTGCKVDSASDWKVTLRSGTDFEPDEPGVLRGRLSSDVGGSIYSKATGKWYR